MTKQTKQLIALIVLVVLAGGFAVWRLDLLGGDAPPPAPATDPAAGGAPAAPGGPVNPGGDPAATPGGQPATPGQTPQTQTTDLEIPDEVKLNPPRYEWPMKRGGANDIPDPRFPVFDPLRVQNIDVVDPDRKKYIEQLRQEWVLDGITITIQERLKIDKTGKPMIGESVMEPKPVYELVPQLDDNKLPVYGPDGEVVLVKRPMYEKDEDGKLVMMDDLDDQGNPRRDARGNVIRVPKPVYEQKVDKDGNPVFENGEPVWVMQPKYRNGHRVVKKIPLILPRQKIVDGKPQFDENGKPELVYAPIYVQALDSEGKPKFVNGEPVYEMIQKKDEDGNLEYDDSDKPVMVPKPKMVEDQTPQTEVVPVKEAWFKDQIRPFRELDRLTNTRFTIAKIFEDRVYKQEGSGEIRVRSGVDLIGDTGAQITLFLADDSRHEKGD